MQELRPNNSFKPNLLRYTNNVAGKACHVVGSATQVGLTQALERSMQDTWHFVAMEYYALILNRTYLVSVSSADITGKVCRGLTAVESGAGLARYITSQLAVHDDLNDPGSYVSDHHLARQDSADFTLRYADIISVSFNPNKKWGMGPYPHDGRVIIVTPEKERELIILGNQSGREVTGRISEIMGRAV